MKQTEQLTLARLFPRVDKDGDLSLTEITNTTTNALGQTRVLHPHEGQED